MIDLLKQRGLCIKTEQWDQMRKVEGLINEKKTEIFDDLCHPCSIFMTFETEEGVNRCRLYDETVAENLEKFEHLRLWLGKHELDIQEASEPSDIIWENREVLPSTRTKRGIIVCTLVTLMLFVSFVIIFVLTNMSNTALMRYPLVSDCTKLAGYDVDDYSKFEEHAIESWKINQALEELEKKVSYKKGYVQCFCDHQTLEGDLPD